jgi:hypothetical protein
MTERQRFRVRVTRDGILFCTGIAGIIYETARQGAERPTLLLLFAGMIGLPAFLQLDSARQAAKPDEAPPKQDVAHSE